MARRRLVIGRVVVPLFAGLAIAFAWLSRTGGDSLAATLRRVNLATVLLMLTATAGWFAIRFVRSQFLLRRAGVRIPIRPALATWLASLPGTATPAYVGEAIRSVFMRRRFGTPMRATLPVLVVERLYDVVALSLAAAAFGGATGARIGVIFFLLAALGFTIAWPLFARAGMPRAVLDRLARPATIGVALMLSIGAWLLAAMLYFVAGAALHAPLSIDAAIAVFSRSTLLGAATLSPAGAGTTGSAAILQLTGSGFALANAVAVVTLVRLMSTGIALLIGVVFLWRELRGVAPAPELVAHFDTIAAEYSAQWSPHVWDLLLDRKLSLMVQALPSPEAAGTGIDLGCGLGIQTGAMRARGFDVVGIEPSVGLLRHRTDRSIPVVAGDALVLPFADGTVDFVYVIGVLHHLPGPQAQAQARQEIARVLKPGGMLLVHESNPRNPFFRFYMGYIFPMLKSIDEGTEHWIDPRSWRAATGMQLEAVRYFTFLPDFTPRLLMRPALAVERWLERGPTRALSAHYMAILRRTPS